MSFGGKPFLITPRQWVYQELFLDTIPDMLPAELWQEVLGAKQHEPPALVRTARSQVQYPATRPTALADARMV